MSEQDDFLDRLNNLADIVAQALAADVLVFSGPMTSNHADRVIQACRGYQAHRTNLVLVLSTFGGDPKAAYRIARHLKQTYQRLIVFVYGYCKSAGTLLALAADELVLSDFAELGPLDLQVWKADEAGEVASSLTPMEALDTLQDESFDLFSQQFKKLRQMEMTTKVAADIASRLTVGLLGQVYSQIDPMRLGELSREVRIAVEYGERLVGTDSRRRQALARLVTGYPTHNFAIDRQEARTLFEGVRPPSNEEEELASHILGTVRTPADPGIIDFVGHKSAANPVEERVVERAEGPRQTTPGGELREDGADAGAVEPSVKSDTRPAN